MRARGPRGRQGKQGKQGAQGLAGRDQTGEIAALSEEVASLVHELKTQLTRIGQLQAQLDRVASGQPPIAARRQKSRPRLN